MNLTNKQTVMDIVKIILVFYMLIIAFLLDTDKTAKLNQPILFVIWFVVGIMVLLFWDIVLGTTLMFALILTYIISSGSPGKNNIGMDNNSTKEPLERTKHTEKYENKDFCEAPLVKMEDSAKALEKYIVDDYLEKAAESGLIKENMDKKLEPLSANHMDIQGTNSIV